MKRFLLHGLKVLLIVCVCSGFLVSCGDDDDDNDSGVTNSISDDNPSYGFMLNSTQYRLLIDIDDKDEFEIALDPGMIIDMHLQTRKTHLMHVLVLNQSSTIIGEYINGFYVDEYPLDNQLKDFLCNWYVEFTAEYPFTGWANEFGT